MLILVFLFFSEFVFANSVFLTQVESITDASLANKFVSNVMFSGFSTPIVDGDEVTFLYFQYRGKSPDKVEIITYDGSFLTNEMKRVGVSDLFVFKTRFSTNFIDYKFKVTFSESSTRFFVDMFNKFVSFRGGIMSKLFKDGYTESLILVYEFEPKTKITNLQKRKIWIYLPKGYYNSNLSYPVLYIQDGQNIWDDASLPFGGWRVNYWVDKLVNEGVIDPIIVVGVENSGERPKEYVGFSTYYGMDVDESNKSLVQENKLKSLAYMDFFVNEVMPFVETNFKVKKGRYGTAIAGSSFGAGVSLHIAFNNREKFSMVGSLSGGHYPTNSQQFKQKPYRVFDYIINEELPNSPIFKIFLSCGTTDIDAMFIRETEKIYYALKSKGWYEGKDLIYLISTNKGHNEKTWSEQVPNMLKFFFGKN